MDKCGFLHWPPRPRVVLVTPTSKTMGVVQGMNPGWNERPCCCVVLTLRNARQRESARSGEKKMARCLLVWERRVKPIFAIKIEGKSQMNRSDGHGSPSKYYYYYFFRGGDKNETRNNTTKTKTNITLGSTCEFFFFFFSKSRHPSIWDQLIFFFWPFAHLLDGTRDRQLGPFVGVHGAHAASARPSVEATGKRQLFFLFLVVSPAERQQALQKIYICTGGRSFNLRGWYHMMYCLFRRWCGLKLRLT